MYLYIHISIFIIKGLKIFSILLLESPGSLRMDLEGSRLFCSVHIFAVFSSSSWLTLPRCRIQSCLAWPRSFLGTNAFRRYGTLKKATRKNTCPRK